MSLPQELHTERLTLRRWQAEDRCPFAAMNADLRVMEYFPALLSVDDSDAMATRIEAHFERHGFGFWAVEIAGQASFAGYIGLGIPRFECTSRPVSRSVGGSRPTAGARELPRRGPGRLCNSGLRRWAS